MEKKIILRMQPSKDIIVSIDKRRTLTIPLNDRTVKADEIYKLLNFSRGDVFTVESENENNLDVPVLKFFEKLIRDIVKNLNKIADNDKDKL